MKITRRRDGSGLAFLDVMACGFGAVLMLFLIVKHNTDAAQIQQHDQKLTDQSVLEELLTEKETLESNVEELLTRIQDRQEQDRIDNEMLEEQAKKRQSLKEILKKVEAQQSRKASLEREIAALQPKQATDVVEQTHVGEEQYLIGMTVKGRRIAIMMDQSASMTDVKLIDIVKRKLGSDQQKRNAPKWQRTTRTIKWLLNRLPQNSEFIVVSFNENADYLIGSKWSASRDKSQLEIAFRELDRMVPSGATNLQAGIEALNKLDAAPTDVYIVTDGLPTKSTSRSTRLSPACLTSAKIVSGECRLKIFETAAKRMRRATINVILLPLEGDPDAARAYWYWTANTGGLTMAPSGDWP